jgi:DNA-binding transcriptional MerR regulator
MSAPVPNFDDGKAPDALRTIGELAKALGIRQHVLRYWEDQFPMLSPLKRSGGRRYYRPEDIALVSTIDRLVHKEGYTLRGARLALEGKGGAVVIPVSAPLPAVSGGNAGQLRTIRDRLAAALAAA